MVDAGANPFPPRDRDEFDEWFRAPVALASADPRIEVRRAQPSEFERIYDLIDTAFGFKRSRALSDWVYRRNPYGLARCWISIERATGALVGSVANWPWPLARGRCPIPAAQGGDAALAEAWRRQGLHERVTEIRESHPWTRTIVHFGWPNAGSVQRVRKSDKKAPRLMGTLLRRVLPLRSRAALIARGLPRPLASLGGGMLDSLFAMWSRTVLDKRVDGRVERVQCFDNAFDDVTLRCMPWEGYWCPHDAAFLNWRYRSDPVREHAAFALASGTTLTGYCVVRVGREQARLMELAATQDQPDSAPTLLYHAIRAAADAGCAYLMVAAPPAWRHWRLLRTAGFVNIPSDLSMYAFSGRDDTPDVQRLENWQFLGGDLDPLSE